MDAGAWAEEHTAVIESMSAAEAIAVIELWREASSAGTGVDGVELAAAFQRHFTARGTGVPANFALVLTAAEVHAFKFDPARAEHPIGVGPDQFSDPAATWPRGAVRATAVKPGRAAWGVTFEVDGAKPIPCRTPRIGRNVAAGIVISALGGAVPQAVSR